MYKCPVLQKELKKTAKAATKNNSAPSLLMIRKLIDDFSRLRELGKLSKLYLLAAVSSYIVNKFNFGQKIGTNQLIAIKRLGLCKLPSSF